jgi:hypothetical protein
MTRSRSGRNPPHACLACAVDTLIPPEKEDRETKVGWVMGESRMGYGGQIHGNQSIFRYALTLFIYFLYCK